MDRSGHSGSTSRRLCVESLESRTLLAGHSADASLGLATATLHHNLPDAVAAQIASADAHAVVKNSVLIAHLSETNTAKGLAIYHTVTAHGTTHTDLEIVVFSGPKHSSLPVLLDGNTTSIGTVRTNGHGFGILHLSDSSLSISNGDTITIGALTGSFSKIGKH